LGGPPAEAGSPPLRGHSAAAVPAATASAATLHIKTVRVTRASVLRARGRRIHAGR